MFAVVKLEKPQSRPHHLQLRARRRRPVLHRASEGEPETSLHVHVGEPLSREASRFGAAVTCFQSGAVAAARERHAAYFPAFMDLC